MSITKDNKSLAFAPKYPLRFSAIRVEQPLGIFYVASIPAHVLLQVAYSDQLVASLVSGKSGYVLEGTQREAQLKRLTQIGAYIDRDDSAFPNSIILAANQPQDASGFSEDGGGDEGAPNEWNVTQTDDGLYLLEIPTDAKLATVVDGQHRLFGFAEARNQERLDMELLCSVYLDLPTPLQAQLFATINSTQKRVDKSLTYELFGYNLSEEKEEFWTPDKLAVFFARKLNTEKLSPLYGKIIVAPRRDPALTELLAETGWKISTAVVVDGILRLITGNPKRDGNEMHSRTSAPRRILEGKFTTDRSPLRDAYLKGNDILIYTTVLNYLRACNELFWANAKSGSFIFRTAGVQALFSVLKVLAKDAYADKKISEKYFLERLRKAAEIDFSQAEFTSSSGAGSTRIRRAILSAIGISP